MAINNLNTGVGIPPTIVDAKGDLIVATGADAVNRLAVGTANQQLVVDSSTSTGLKWAAPAGLVLLNTTSFSGVVSQSINSVFTSAYDNYYVEIDFIVASVGGDTALKLRSSGTDKSTNYIMTGSHLNGTSVGSYGSGTTTLTYILPATATNLHFVKLNICRPAISGQTVILSDSNAAATENRYIITSRQTETLSFDGFSFINVGSNNMTGKIKVFGVNQ